MLPRSAESTTSDGAPRTDRLRPPVPVRWAVGLVLLGYAVLALFVTWSWWTPLGGRASAINRTDADLFGWLLGWTPHALSTGGSRVHRPSTPRPG